MMICTSNYQSDLYFSYNYSWSFIQVIEYNPLIILPILLWFLKLHLISQKRLHLIFLIQYIKQYFYLFYAQSNILYKILLFIYMLHLIFLKRFCAFLWLDKKFIQKYPSYINRINHIRNLISWSCNW